LTSANLALTFSGSYGRRVLLVDADLRRPMLHRLFGLPDCSGLNEALKAPAERTLPLVQITPELSLLPGGSADSDPLSGLTSGRMRQIVAEAAAAFDWVIMDTAPVALLPDSRLLASM